MPRRLTLPADLLPALRTDAWFAACPSAMQEGLWSRAQLWSLAPGETLFNRGAEPQGLCCVTAGMLRIGYVQPDGSATLLACVEPYQWLGEVSLIDAQPRTHNAVAEGDTQVLVIPQADMLDWLAQDPALWRELGRLACGKLRAAFTVLEHMASLPLPERVLRHLQLVAQGYGSRTDSTRQRVRLSQEQLALMLGVSRQSANKALKELEERGVIVVGYGEIELVRG